MQLKAVKKKWPTPVQLVTVKGRCTIVSLHLRSQAEGMWKVVYRRQWWFEHSFHLQDGNWISMPISQAVTNFLPEAQTINAFEGDSDRLRETVTVWDRQWPFEGDSDRLRETVTVWGRQWPSEGDSDRLRETVTVWGRQWPFEGDSDHLRETVTVSQRLINKLNQSISTLFCIRPNKCTRDTHS